MNKITKEELLKLAYLSRLQLASHELDALIHEIEAVLQYAQRVKDVAQEDIQIVSRKNSNRFRPDTVQKTDAQTIMSQAPVSEQNYFVVPAILETT